MASTTFCCSIVRSMGMVTWQNSDSQGVNKVVMWLQVLTRVNSLSSFCDFLFFLHVSGLAMNFRYLLYILIRFSWNSSPFVHCYQLMRFQLFFFFKISFSKFLFSFSKILFSNFFF
jgi:hypothetical protein